MSTPDIQSVLRGQDHFRLKEVVQSFGSNYEIQESAQSIFLGPDSDISEVEIQYYNPAAPLSLMTARVSPGAPFVGRIDSLGGTKVSSTQDPATILVYPIDVVNNQYVRPTPDAPGPSRRSNVNAIIDLIFANQKLPVIPAQRADKTHRFLAVPFEYVNGNPDGSTDIVIPMYGRRMISISVASAVPYALDCYAGSMLSGGSLNVTPLLLGRIDQATSTTQSVTRTAVYRASDQWSSRFSVPSTEVTTNRPFAPAKGQLGFFVLNVRAYSPFGGVSFIEEIVVRLSDREE